MEGFKGCALCGTRCPGFLVDGWMGGLGTLHMHTSTGTCTQVKAPQEDAHKHVPAIDKFRPSDPGRDNFVPTNLKHATSFKMAV